MKKKYRALANLLLSVWILLAACAHSSDGRKFSFNSVGWTISIPDGYVAEDSASFYSKVQQVKNLPPSADSIPKRLLTVIDSAGIFSTAYKLEAIIRPLGADRLTLDQYTDTLRARLDTAIAHSFGGEQILEATYTTPDIDGQKFNRSSYRISRNDKHVDNVSNFETIVRNKLLSISLVYRDGSAEGVELENRLMNSRFAKQ